MKTDSFAQALKFATLSIDYRVRALAKPDEANACNALAENRRGRAQVFLDVWLEGVGAPERAELDDLDIMRLGGAPAPTDRDVV